MLPQTLIVVGHEGHQVCEQFPPEASHFLALSDDSFVVDDFHELHDVGVITIGRPELVALHLDQFSALVVLLLHVVFV